MFPAIELRRGGTHPDPLPPGVPAMSVGPRTIRLAVAVLALATSAITTSLGPAATARERCTNIDHEHWVADSGHYHHWRYFATEDYPDGYHIISYMPEHDTFKSKRCVRPTMLDTSGPGEPTDPYNTIELIERLTLPNT
jgi:hypothetical protein